MRAAVYDRYGLPDVLRIDDVPVPAPAAGQVLVAVAATSINLSDCERLTGSPFHARLGGLRSPAHRTLGSDIAGRVEAVGEGVTRFRSGAGRRRRGPGARRVRRPAGLTFTRQQDPAGPPSSGPASCPDDASGGTG